MNNQCISEIRNIYQAISGFEHKLEKAFGTNINELMLLCTLSEQDDMTSGEIAEALNLTASNASKVIASMEKKNCVERHMCKNDKRCMRFNLTDKGRELLSRVNCKDVQVPEDLRKLL